jgi:Heterokaryon incompatibility protein (HET)
MHRSAGAEVLEYVYAALSQPRAIRVATLLPGEKSDLLQVTLREHDLESENFHYEAVSYCWGGVNRDFQVQSDGRAILVTENLIAALLRFRHPTNHRVLWIDTICINQNAIDERNCQVKLMGDVYQKAARVLVWLGEEAATTELAYNCMRAYFDFEVPNIWRQFESESRKIRGSAAWDENYKTHPKLQYSPPEIAAFQKLLDRPWFSRAWTFQEGRLSRESLLVTGSYEIQGSSISKIEDGIRALCDEVGFCLFGEDFLYRVTFLYFLFNPDFVMSLIPRLDFWEALRFLLIVRRGAETSDPRDIVYSLIGIASLTSALQIEPEYRTSWQKLYTSLTRQFICKSGHLEQLVAATPRSASLSNLPTWVPDWMQPAPSRISTPELHHLPRKYHASGSSRVSISHNHDPSKLQLRGLRCDEVARIGLSKLEINDFLTHNFLWSSNILFVDKMTSFMTSGDLLGFGPHHLEVGDHVFVLLGGEVPYLLRETEAETEYTFVGECYIHGLMSGEALLEARKMADPLCDLEDTAWLKRLHEEEIPFPTMDVVII